MIHLSVFLHDLVRVPLQQILCEISKLRNENDKLQAGMRQYMGEDLTALTAHDLDQLEEQLEYSVNKVRARKVH